MPQHQKARGVVGLVFDVGSEFGQMVMLGGGLTGNGGGLRLGSGEAGGFGGRKAEGFNFCHYVGFFGARGADDEISHVYSFFRLP